MTMQTDQDKETPPGGGMGGGMGGGTGGGMGHTMGRGLGSLLGEGAFHEVELDKVRRLPLDRIRPNPRQPRQVMDDGALAELADSIRAQGVLQPILVRPVAGEPEQFELVAGERRWRAARLAGLERIPVLVREWADDQALEAAILENVQREDLNPIETAMGYESLIRLFGYSHKKVGRRVGKSRAAVSNLLRLLKLPQPVQEWLADGTLSSGHARALLALEDEPERLRAVAGQVVTDGLSVRQAESLIRDEAEKAAAGDEQPPPKPRPAGRRQDPVIREMEKRLTEGLTTRVTITHTRGRGRLILEYDSPEELELLSNRLLSGR